jgi:hypothetical protein
LYVRFLLFKSLQYLNWFIPSQGGISHPITVRNLQGLKRTHCEIIVGGQVN